MRKWIACAVLTVMLLCASLGAMAAGVTLRLFTPFADLDEAAQSYMDMLTAWESATGNIAEDYSGLTDEAWMHRMRESVRMGEADILVVPLGSGLTYEELVTVEELLAVAPELGARRFAAYAEADGSVLLSPMRISWEALYINTDVLGRLNLSVPQTYEELLALCAALSAQGVTPMANAPGDWAEILLDCLALAGAAPEEFGSEASLIAAQQMLAALYSVGAFGEKEAFGSDMEAMQAFADGRAAMRVDSDMLAQMLPAGREDSVIVIPFPQKLGMAHGMLPGLPSFGVAITRACWKDDARREAAISLVSAMLTQGETYRSLAACAGGTLGESIAVMLQNAADCAGILFDRMDGDFDVWIQGVVEGL